jgi:hypothetical protein
MVAEVVDQSRGSEGSRASAELRGADFGDPWLNAHAERLLEQWDAKPSLSIPAACGGNGSSGRPAARYTASTAIAASRQPQ